MNTQALPVIARDPSQERTELAVKRTALAAERTLMSWVRTALSMISFGFTIYKFLQYLAEGQMLHLRHPNGPRNLGLLLIGLGTLALVGGVLEYWATMKSMPPGSRRLSFGFYLSWAIVGLGLVLFYGALRRIGPF